MDWFYRKWDSLPELIAYVENSSGIKATETPVHLIDLASKVREKFPKNIKPNLDKVELGLLPEARFNAYAMNTKNNMAISIDNMMATILPAFTVITWGTTLENPNKIYYSDPRQLIWLVCSIAIGDIRPILNLPCWEIVFGALQKIYLGYGPALKMIDIQLAWILSHEYAHIAEKHLELKPCKRYEFEVDRIATEITWMEYGTFTHFIWSIQIIFLLFAILERFEPINNNSHPTALDRIEAIRKHIFKKTKVDNFAKLLFEKFKSLHDILTSFDPDAAMYNWRKISNEGGSLLSIK